MKMQIGRTKYRMAHWMRAILSNIDLSDVPLTGFMPLPGSGDVIRPDGSNAAFDWGEPEHIHRHLPEQIVALRSERGEKGHRDEATCRAIVSKKQQRRRCSNK